MEMSPTIHLRLAETMREKGLNQKQLAEKSGISRQALSTLTHRPLAIRLDTLAALCAALGIDPGELLILKDDPPGQ